MIIMPKWLAKTVIALFIAALFVGILLFFGKCMTTKEMIVTASSLASIFLFIWALHSLDMHDVRERDGTY